MIDSITELARARPVVTVAQRFAIDSDDGESEIYYCTVRRLYAALLIEDVLTVADARGRGLARQLLAHVAAQYPHEDVYLIADNNGYEDPTLSNEQLIVFYGRCGFEQTTFPGGMVRRAPRVGRRRALG